jgi:pyruvate-formate lyase-activating enzyme
MEKIVIENIDELIKDGRITRPLKNLDLSNIDLSNIDPQSLVYKSDYVELRYLLYTDFSNTGIKLKPQLFKYRSRDRIYISNCNFTNCDLSYLKAEDFANVRLSDNNYTNTNLNISIQDYAKASEIEVRNKISKVVSKELVTESYHNDDIHDLDICNLTLDDILEKKYIKVSSAKLLNIIKENYSLFDLKYLFLREEFIDEFKKILDLDYEGHLKKLFNIVNPETENDLLLFVRGIVRNKEFDEVDISDFDIDFLNELRFDNCKINKLSLPYDVITNNLNYTTFDKYCNFKNVYIKDLKYTDWQDKVDDRLSKSHVTLKTNLYLELGRGCNCNCKFCRNKSLNDCRFDFEKIKKNLEIMIPRLDSIIIGGGEPTLHMNELIELNDLINYRVSNRIIVTNGSANIKTYQKLLSEGYQLELSRHATGYKANQKILNPKSGTTITDDLRRLNDSANRGITLCVTCFKGGVDSFEKIIEYIDWAYKNKIHHLIFQSIHEDLESNIEKIDDDVFNKVLNYYRNSYANISDIIYSTGNYKLVIIKDDDYLRKSKMTISLKKYITEEELQENWYNSQKRTFDISMSPNGDIYDNWNQSTEKVKLKTLK